MSSRVHFYLASDPITTWDSPLSGLCGAEVAHPRPEVMWVLGERISNFNGMRDCLKCIRLVEHSPIPNRQYVYGLVEAELALHRGEGEA